MNFSSGSCGASKTPENDPHHFPVTAVLERPKALNNRFMAVVPVSVCYPAPAVKKWRILSEQSPTVIQFALGAAQITLLLGELSFNSHFRGPGTSTVSCFCPDSNFGATRL